MYHRCPPPSDITKIRSPFLRPFHPCFIDILRLGVVHLGHVPARGLGCPRRICKNEHPHMYKKYLLLSMGIPSSLLSCRLIVFLAMLLGLTKLLLFCAFVMAVNTYAVCFALTQETKGLITCVLDANANTSGWPRRRIQR